MIIVLETKAHISDLKCQELMLPFKFVCTLVGPGKDVQAGDLEGMNSLEQNMSWLLGYYRG